MLPQFIIDRLAKGQAVLPEFYDSTTIYFSDIDGFEEIGRVSSPHQIVDMLNGLYK